MDKEVIIVLHSLAIGGAERHLSSIANYMAQRGIKVHMLLTDKPTVLFDLDSRIKVVCINQNPDLSDYDKSKCELFKLDSIPKISFSERILLKFSRIFSKKYAEYLEKKYYLKYAFSIPIKEYVRNFPSAVIASFMIYPNISLMMTAKDLPNRVLFGEFTDPATEYPPRSVMHKLKRVYYKNADGGIFQTPVQADYYSFIPNIKQYIIPNILNSDVLPERFVGERRKDIVNFCRICEPKNLSLLIDAFAKLHKEYPEYMLSIYGEGPLKQKLLEQISELGLEKSVIIYPFDRDLHSKIRDAAMFVSSSDREGISNSMLEAMAIGMPCVCTDCAGGGARMMIENHVNGLLVPMKDKNALYLGMKEIIENPALAEKMSVNAVNIKERLKPEVICEQMISAIFDE